MTFALEVLNLFNQNQRIRLGEKMFKFLLSLILLLIIACEDAKSPTQTDPPVNTSLLGCTDEVALNYNLDATEDDGSCEYAEDTENTSWVFIANEGTYGASNGSISMIDDNGDIYETDYIGDVVQSLEVYGDKLIVLVNNSHMIKIYDITSEGLAMPGIEVYTNGSSPRDLVVMDDKVYFTNWNSQDVKVFNLFSYNIEASIPIDGLPEDINFDGQNLWVTIPHNDSYLSPGSTVAKIDIESNSVVEVIEVGYGPQEIIFDNGEIYISRTFYDDTWNAFHGTTKIGQEVLINNYGSGVVCGGSILSYNDKIYRSFDNGITSLNEDLDINESDKIGNFNYSVYHAEVINNNVWLSITDFASLNQVKVLNSNGSEIASYDVGINPGDFSVWPNISGTREVETPPKGF